MSRKRRGRAGVLAAAGLGLAAALAWRAPSVRATDFKQSYADRVLPVARPSASARPLSPGQRQALAYLLREDLVSWHAEVFAPLAFTNRTCVRLRQEFLVRMAGRALREDIVKMQRTVISVRQGMLEKAIEFVPRTDNVRELNRLLCEVMRLHVAWMTRITEQQFDLNDCPAPPELVEAKRAFTSALAGYRHLLADAPDPGP